MHYRTKGNEAERLVKLLRDEYPEARKLLTQPSVLKELWIYAETGRFRQAKMENALRPLTETSKRAGELAEAIRSNQWRAMRDERQTHYEFLRLEAQLLSWHRARHNPAGPGAAPGAVPLDMRAHAGDARAGQRERSKSAAAARPRTRGERRAHHLEDAAPGARDRRARRAFRDGR